MACCGGCCGGESEKSAPGVSMLIAGLAVGVAILIGVFGMGQAASPAAEKPATPPATEPVKQVAPAASPASTDDTTKEQSVAKAPLDFKVQGIDGKECDLSQYKGKVVVIVNVASKCGFTDQYAGLQEMYLKHKDAGLVVLGFPANDFNAQEPGTNLEIAKFCSSKFSVTFPMFEKVTVKGEEISPLYKVLTSQPEPIGGEPKWNFTKFVIDRDGKVAARFDADKKYVRSKQLEPELLKKVDELLATKPTITPASPAIVPAPVKK